MEVLGSPSPCLECSRAGGARNALGGILDCLLEIVKILLGAIDGVCE